MSKETSSSRKKRRVEVDPKWIKRWPKYKPDHLVAEITLEGDLIVAEAFYKGILIKFPKEWCVRAASK